MKIFKWLVALWVTLALVACGGGGGNPGAVAVGTGTGTNTGTGTGGTETVAGLMTVAFVDGSGSLVAAIDAGHVYYARATLKDAAGKTVTGKTVTFSTPNSSIAVLSPDTALTNASGQAQVKIAPASLSSIGAATVQAVASVNGTDVTGSGDFAVQQANLTLSGVSVGSVSLVSGGNTTVSVTALIDGTAATGIPVNVGFTTSCGRINAKDTTSSPVGVTTDGSGVASVTYDATAVDGKLCSGTVNIFASSAGAQTKSTQVTVASATADALAFVSASPSQIYVFGSGAVAKSLVKFKVFANNVAQAGVPVSFALVSAPSGVTLSASNGETDSIGEVTVAVFAGTVPGPVKVRVTLKNGSAALAESMDLTVFSGPPSQRYMSLSVETFNIEGMNRDGATTTLTVRVADRQGNPVPDGTVINFTAEGGQVYGSCATKVTNGISKCSTTFESQNPRPVNGRVAVLAHVEGVKGYVDVNGNNVFDSGVDTLINIGDAYRDDNENGQYDVGEFVILREETGATCASVGAPFPARAGNCGVGDATTVRQQTTILFSSSEPVPLEAGVDGTTVTRASIDFKLRSKNKDNLLLPMPAGTKIEAVGFPADALTGLISCEVIQQADPVPNVQPTWNLLDDLATRHVIGLQCDRGDQVQVKITTPSGIVSTYLFTLP